MTGYEKWCVHYWCEEDECGHPRAKKPPLPPRKLDPVEEAVEYGRGGPKPPTPMQRY